MLEIFIVCLFVAGLNWIVKKGASAKIEQSKTVSQNVKIRRSYRNVKIAILLGFTLYVICAFIFSFDYMLYRSSRPGFYLYMRQVMLVSSMIMGTYATMSLPISDYTIGKFRKKKSKDFVLFLRGFSHDNYTPAMLESVIEQSIQKSNKAEKKDVQSFPFSEKDFCKAIKQYLPIYAVGIPKELETPQGAKRIYLNNETWQDDISMLITEAKYIFVLVNPSDNCIWEIRQCDKLAKQKTVYLIDNEDDFLLLTKKMQDDIPNVLKFIRVSKHNMIYAPKDYRRVCTYQNDYNGFKIALKKCFEEIQSKE
ncbi:MAG: hypothetical protein IKW35_06890 [Paludibacteraceae bacterium]|nr:hypothetical protein [Paludibacteraceae bacterium]